MKRCDCNGTCYLTCGLQVSVGHELKYAPCTTEQNFGRKFAVTPSYWNNSLLAFGPETISFLSRNNETMANSLYERCLHGIMADIFIKTNIQSKTMKITTMIPCRHILEGIKNSLPAFGCVEPGANSKS